MKWNSDKLGIFTQTNGENLNVEFGISGDLSANGKAANFGGSLNSTTQENKTTVYGYYPRNTIGSNSQAIPIDLANQTDWKLWEQRIQLHFTPRGQ